MQTKSLLKKGLVCGIVVLLVGISITPMVSSLPIEQHVSIASSTKDPGPWDVNWTINGTMGYNGWYVSPLNFSCNYDHENIVAVYYKVHASEEWELYMEPFTVFEQGTFEFYWYFVDYQGIPEAPEGPFPFKIDYTKPTIDLTVTAQNCCHTKWLLNATVADATSGVEKVEFYVDDVLVGNISAPPYLFIYHGRGRVAQAIVYDFAGNSAMNPIIIMPLISQQSPNQNSPSVQQKTMLFRDLIYNLLLHHQMEGGSQ